MAEFKKRFFGKWVLAGEYSVFRSFPALVYPLSYYYIDFYYKKSNSPMQIERGGKYQMDLDFSVSPLFDKALKMANKQRSDLKGSLVINSFIPFGAGLGASSVICAGAASLFLYKGWISQESLKELSISLEDLFHGKSSGMDVNVVLEKKAILYQRGEKTKYIPKFQTKPCLFLSYSGGRSLTSVGVSKVRNFFDQDRKQAEQIDEEMAQSVELCLLALKEKDRNKSKKLLIQALSLGEKCFHKWNLISYDLERHMYDLKKQGALAVKPTGSGLGGYVISLWDTEPAAHIKQDMIPLDI